MFYRRRKQMPDVFYVGLLMVVQQSLGTFELFGARWCDPVPPRSGQHVLQFFFYYFKFRRAQQTGLCGVFSKQYVNRAICLNSPGAVRNGNRVSTPRRRRTPPGSRKMLPDAPPPALIVVAMEAVTELSGVVTRQTKQRDEWFGFGGRGGPNIHLFNFKQVGFYKNKR